MAWALPALAVALLQDAAAAECDAAAQHSAMVAFATATDMAAWAPGSQWPLEEADHCAWTGVACEDNCVVSMELASADLGGTLPEVWGGLASLRTLELAGASRTNRIGGPLPASFAQLQALEYLGLGGNSLTGPVGVVEAMPALEEVYLWGNAFEGPLPELGQPLLRELRMDSNLLTGPIFAGYGSLPLNRIRLDGNALSSTVPPELGALPQSTLIDLGSNPRLGGVLPHSLLGRGGNLRLGGTQVTVGCPAGVRYDVATFACAALCPAGTSTPAESYATACDPCGPGSAAPSAGSACSLCAAGTYSDGVANAECVACAAGAVSAAGASECTLCGPGHFAASDEDACQRCRPGFFSNGTANAECTACPDALAAPFLGSTFCEPCGAGRISTNGGGACRTCFPGSSTNGAEVASLCTACPAGTVAPDPGSPVCEPCAVGTSSNDVNTACDACPVGTSTEGAAGAPMCLQCPAGSTAGIGAAECAACEPGSFAAEPGLEECELCPAGSTTDGAAGAAVCTPCPAGSFAGAGNATCTLCAPGSFAASAGLVNCTLCPAGTHQPEAGAVESECPVCRYPGRCLEGNTCSEGYAGAGCLFCSVGHFRLSNVCLECPVVPWPLFILLALGAGLYYAASKNRLGPRQTTVLKIVLFYVQMVVVGLTVQVEWPATQTKFVEAMSFASAEIGLPMAECYVDVGWYAGFTGSLAGPVAVILVFWMATVFVDRQRRRAWAATEDAEQDFSMMARASHVRRLWITACAMMHLPLVRVLLSAFDCERDADGELVVAGSDDGTSCSSDTHVAVQSLSGAAMTLIGVVLPIGAMWFVLRLRRTKRLDVGEVQAAWGALFESYRREYCFLEGVVALRKVFVTLALVVPGIPAGWRSFLLLLQSLGWGVFVFVQRPYVRVRGRAVFGLVKRSDLINELEVVVSLVVAVHQGVAGLAVASNDSVVWFEAGVILVVVTVIVLLAGLWQASRIGRGYEVAPTGFNQAKAERDQRVLHRSYLLAIGRKDFEEAARVRTEGVRHARQTREFAEWRQASTSRVSTTNVPFLEMVIAEETTTREELKAAIEAASTEKELVARLNNAAAAGHFDLMRKAHNRLYVLESGSTAAGSSRTATPSRSRPRDLASTSSKQTPTRLPPLSPKSRTPALRQ